MLDSVIYLVVVHTFCFVLMSFSIFASNPSHIFFLYNTFYEPSLFFVQFVVFFRSSFIFLFFLFYFVLQYTSLPFCLFSSSILFHTLPSLCSKFSSSICCNLSSFHFSMPSEIFVSNFSLIFSAIFITSFVFFLFVLSSQLWEFCDRYIFLILFYYCIIHYRLLFLLRTSLMWYLFWLRRTKQGIYLLL